MKKYAAILLALSLMSLPCAALAKVPHTIAGISLGSMIDEHKGLLLPESRVQVRSAPYMFEVRIKPGAITGFGEGSIYCADCKDPDRIIRLKLEYADPSRKGFERLLEAYKKRFGKPDEWRGDAFHNRLAWKWGMKDERGRRVTIVLSHSNLAEDKPGNWVKFTLRSLWEQERDCWEEKHPGDDPMPLDTKPIVKLGSDEFEKLLPR